ncbi:hypothetical protein ACFSM5_11385 [Lacibacterium aquatile]|uniref:Prevent-host-death protein n=1 Tax=Lacibacterium aquatile TaxID=1168082 RepID=A0ABW5DSA2_9PROT
MRLSRLEVSKAVTPLPSLLSELKTIRARAVACNEMDMDLLSDDLDGPAEVGFTDQFAHGQFIED